MLQSVQRMMNRARSASPGAYYAIIILIVLGLFSLSLQWLMDDDETLWGFDMDYFLNIQQMFNLAVLVLIVVFAGVIYQRLNRFRRMSQNIINQLPQQIQSRLG